jgi:hypothetical protein
MYAIENLSITVTVPFYLFCTGRMLSGDHPKAYFLYSYNTHKIPYYFGCGFDGTLNTLDAFCSKNLKNI